MDDVVRGSEFAFRGLLKDVLRFSQTIESRIVLGKKAVLDSKVRRKLDRFLTFLYCLFFLAEHSVDKARQESMRQHFSRIGLYPGFTGLLGLFLVSRRASIIVGGNEELLVVTGAISQFIGFADAFRSQVRLSPIAVHEPQSRVCDGEFGVNLNGALEEGNGSSRTHGSLDLQPRAVGLQGFE